MRRKTRMVGIACAAIVATVLSFGSVAGANTATEGSLAGDSNTATHGS